MNEPDVSTAAAGIERRDFLRRTAVTGAAGALVWATPSIRSGSPAFASGGSPEGCGGVLFTDDFEGEPNVPVGGYREITSSSAQQLANWTLVAGTIDVINGNYGACNGKALDLDGSSNAPGTIELTPSIPIVTGRTYKLTFDLGKNGSAAEQVTVVFGATSGTASQTFDPPASGCARQETEFVAAADGVLYLSFQDTGSTASTNAGAVLDNVAIEEICPV